MIQTKKILFLTQLLPYPPDNGGKIKTLAILKLLKKLNYQVYLGCFVDQKNHLSYQTKLAGICRQVKAIYHPVVTRSHRQVKRKGILSLFSSKPFAVYKYHSHKLHLFVEQISAQVSFDLVYIDHLHLAQYLPDLTVKGSFPKLVYDEHNVSSLGMWRNFKIEANPLTKAMYLVEAVKWRRYERRQIAKFDLVLAISQEDGQQLIKLGAKPQGVHFLPIPMATKPVYRFKQGKANIIFVGLLSWRPNADAVWWFYRQVLPLIQAQLPQATLTVIGANPSRKLVQTGKEDKKLRVVGYVAKLEKYFAEAGVFVAPIRSAGGVRVKILTALAHGIPTVTTHLGLEGVAAVEGKDILIADKKQAFAKAVLQIVTDKIQAQTLSRNGLKFIASQYNKTRTRKILVKQL